jgi:hypothetical protein
VLTKFATQVDEVLLKKLRQMARYEGRQLQALVGDALHDYVERRAQGYIRPDLRRELERTLREFGSVYNGLASYEQRKR